jgi:hypothetical protein
LHELEISFHEGKKISGKRPALLSTSIAFNYLAMIAH